MENNNTIAAIAKSPIMGWKDFVNEFENYSEVGKYIFRGQSNAVKKIDGEKDAKGRIITTAPIEWEIISTFNRYYQGSNHYNFSTFISQQIDDDLFRITYGKYESVSKHSLLDSKTLDKLFFLQHYGCPTCLIDFTKNPLVALYFGITSIKGSSGTTYDADGNIMNYSDECFFSIYQINTELLTAKLGIRELDISKNLSLTYSDYEIYLDNYSRLHSIAALISYPKSSIDNFNLEKQKGCFLLYDNYYFKLRNSGFENFISEFVDRRNIELEEPIVYVYRISYNSIFKKNNHWEMVDGLFSYLLNKKVYGAYLFNDMQGLKYDFNFFHQI